MEAILVRPRDAGQQAALELIFRGMGVPFEKQGEERPPGFDMKLLEQAIERASPNMERIADVDELVDSLKGGLG